MTKTVDGIDFPDDMSDEDIMKALATQGGGDTGSPTHPTDEKTWTSTILDSLNNNLRGFNRGATLGGWDNLVGAAKYPFGAGSPSEERAKTVEAKKHMILGGAIPETLGTAASTFLTGGLMPEAAAGATGVRAIPNVATRIAALPIAKSIGTGAVMSGTEAEMDQKSAEETLMDMGVGGVGGGLLHGVAAGANKVGKWWSGTPSKPPNTAVEDLRKLKNSEYNAIKQYVYPRRVFSDIANASDNDVKNTITSTASGAPMDEAENKKAIKLFEDFGERFKVANPVKGQTGKPGTPVWPKEAESWRRKAAALPGDDADYGNILAKRIEDAMQNGPTIRIGQLGEKVPTMTPEIQDAYNEEAYRGILAARTARSKQKALEAVDEASKTGANTPIKQAIHADPDIPSGVQEILRQANKGTFASNTAERANAVIPNAIRAATGAATGYLGLKGAMEPAIATGIGGFVTAPAAGMVTKPIADAARERMLQQVRDRLTGAARPRPDTTAEDRFRQMLMGGWLSQQ